MKLVHNRSQEKQQSEYLAHVPLAQFNNRLKQSRRYQVFGSGNGKYQVEIPDSSRKYIVDLNLSSCNRENFSYYQAACTHAIAVYKYAAEDPFEYVGTIYTTKALIQPLSSTD